MSPLGERVDEACCAQLECGEVVTFADPVTGECVSGQAGCSAPPVAPSCDVLGAQVCDVGLFAAAETYIARQSGVCIGHNPFLEFSYDDREARLKMKVRNYTAREARFEVIDQCPAGDAIWGGLPEGYDPYQTCMDGVCETTGQPQAVSIEAGAWSILHPSAEVRTRNEQCNEGLPAGRYTLTATLLLVEGSALRFCDFTWLQLDVSAPPED